MKESEKVIHLTHCDACGKELSPEGGAKIAYNNLKQQPVAFHKDCWEKIFGKIPE